MCSIFPLAHLNERIKCEKREKHTCTWYMAKTYPNICECECEVRITSTAFKREEKCCIFIIQFISFRYKHKISDFFASFVSWNYIPWYILMPSHTVECSILFGIIKKRIPWNRIKSESTKTNEPTAEKASADAAAQIFLYAFSFSRILCFETSFFGRVSRTNNIWQA